MEKTKAELKVNGDIERIELIKKWDGRLKALASREKNPLNQAEFCEKYGFDKNYFSRMKRLEFVAKKDKVDPVEAAFKKERV